MAKRCKTHGYIECGECGQDPLSPSTARQARAQELSHSAEVLDIQATKLLAVFDAIDTGDWSKEMVDQLDDVKLHLVAGVALTNIDLTPAQGVAAKQQYDELCNRLAYVGQVAIQFNTGTWDEFARAKYGMN